MNYVYLKFLLYFSSYLNFLLYSSFCYFRSLHFAQSFSLCHLFQKSLILNYFFTIIVHGFINLCFLYFRFILHWVNHFFNFCQVSPINSQNFPFSPYSKFMIYFLELALLVIQVSLILSNLDNCFQNATFFNRHLLLQFPLK